MQSELHSFQTGTLKQQIQEIVKIPATASDLWEISDQQPPLYLINLKKNNASAEQHYGWIRGIVVDVETQIVVCKSVGYTPTVIGTQLAQNQDKFSVYDKGGATASYNLFSGQKVEINPLYEGTLLRIFKYKNCVYYSTHRKLDCSRSRWGSQKTFFELFKELSPPEESVLFPTNVITSPVVYNFIVCHPQLLVASKIPLYETGYLIYLGCTTMWDTRAPPPFKNEGGVGEAHTPSNLEYPSNIEYFPTQPKTLSPAALTVKEGNFILQNGYWGKEKYTDFVGEGLMITIKTAQGQVQDMFKVHSPGYAKRLALRGWHSNLECQLYNLYNTTRKAGVPFFQKFAAIAPLNRDELEKQLEENPKKSFIEPHQIHAIPFNFSKATDKLKNRAFKFGIVWSCFFLSVPFARQKQVLQYFKEFYGNCKRVATWLLSNYPNLPSVPKKESESAPRELEVYEKEQCEKLLKYIAEQSYPQQTPEDLWKVAYEVVKGEEGMDLYRLVHIVDK